LFAVLLLASSTAGCYRELQSMRGSWKFHEGFETDWLIHGLPADSSVVDVPGSYHAGKTNQITLQREFSGLKNEPLAADFGKLSDVSEVFINEKKAGGAGHLNPYLSGSYRSVWVLIPPEASGAGKFRITIVLGTDGEKPLEAHGPDMRIGNLYEIQSAALDAEILVFSLLAIFLCVGIFHLFLFVRRRYEPYLHFALFSILLSFYWVFFTRAKDDFFGDNINLRIKTEFILLFLMGPSFLQFLSGFLRNRASRMAYVLLGLYAILGFIVAASSSFHIMRLCLIVWQLTAIPGMLYILGFIALLAFRGNRDAIYLLTGIAVLMAGGIHDILVSLGFLKHQHISIYTFIPLVPSIAWVLANHLMRNYSNTEIANRSLEKTVETQTIIARQLEEDRSKAESDLDRLAGIITRKETFFQNLDERALVYSSPVMQQVIEKAHQIVRMQRPALVTGETGTGKELIARYIHLKNEPSPSPFIAINCAAVPSSLWEDEIFGHVRGAFTDAKSGRTGRIQEAENGTLFLDEIGEMPLEMQSKLLRVLQEKIYYPVGSEKTQDVKCRFIFATNRDLLEEVKAGHFREDLYYRINVMEIHLPPLRERREDIPLIASHFTTRLGEELGLPPLKFTDEALRALVLYDWPGNIRELENNLVRAAAAAENGKIQVSDLPSTISLLKPEQEKISLAGDFETLTHEYARGLIRTALIEARGNKSAAAKLLGIKRSRLNYQIRELGLD